MIKAVLFDMDGVLIDAREWHYEALNRALEPFGLLIDRDAHLATFDGLPTRTKLDILSKSRGVPIKLHDLISKLKQKYTMELITSRCRPVFQHQYMLASLKQQGFNIAVCSNSIRASIVSMMDLAGLSQYLDCIFSNEDVERPKPDPAIYLAAMQRLGVAPHECVIVEDNDHGLQAARASGGHVLQVVSPDDVNFHKISRFICEVSEKN